MSGSLAQEKTPWPGPLSRIQGSQAQAGSCPTSIGAPTPTAALAGGSQALIRGHASWIPAPQLRLGAVGLRQGVGHQSGPPEDALAGSNRGLRLPGHQSPSREESGPAPAPWSLWGLKGVRDPSSSRPAGCRVGSVWGPAIGVRDRAGGPAQCMLVVSGKHRLCQTGANPAYMQTKLTV